jgi:hypothetical protein
MTLTAELSQSEPIELILATERQYGELACGPNFLLDFKLFSHTSRPKSVAGVYKLIKAVYKETPLPEPHLADLLSTIDRDETSEYWNAKEAVTELTAEGFGEWLMGCCLGEEYYESESEEENPCAVHQAQLTETIAAVQPLIFPSDEPVKLYTLTDTDNENTPYGIYVAIGETHTLVVVSHWIL